MKIYLKSIEQIIPYGQMARQNRELEKYIEKNRIT